MKITKHLTKVNFTKGNNKQNLFIVIHWVGAVSTAGNNAKYFEKENRGASAHYFVDDTSVYKVVNDKDIAWHCGSSNGKYNHATCRNSNSIGIEMCLDKKDNISPKTIKKTAKLVQKLMKKHNIKPENVIRHYDVTGKLCPAPYVDKNNWKILHAILTDVEQSIENTKTFPKTLYLGDTGTDVELLQKTLNDKTVAIDGKFGARTLASVQKYQKDNDLIVDGIVGEKTWTKLLSK